MEENRQVFHCFTLCDSQLRVGMGGAYALDWNTVSALARSLLLDEDEEFYRKLRSFEQVMIGEINKRGED